MSRLAGAVQAVRDAIATAAGFPVNRFRNDDDIVDDLLLDELELESLSLILEEIFAMSVPETLWSSPLYRTPASLAEWCVRKSDEAAWAESQRQRRSA